MQIAVGGITRYPPVSATPASPIASMKYQIFLGLFAVAAAYPGLIHEEAPQFDHQALIGETGHHQQIQHEHAKSHQSIKFEHFHPVPVYIKKEHSHLLHHPLEKGQSESNLKQIHPETQQAHGYGLVLEDHRLNTDHLAANLGHGDYSAGLEHGSLENGGLKHAGFSQGLSHGGYEQPAGGYESGEGLKAYAEAEPELQGHFGGPIQVSGGSEESHGYGHY